jgi:quercetin dioxygenase-like cupin family protein
MNELFPTGGTGSLESHDWGDIRWLTSASQDSAATMTVGICRIRAGHSNPLHRHPNFDEVLVVISGQCRKRVGDQVSTLGPGDSVRIPRGVEHQAATLGDDPLVCFICYDTPRREIELL